MIGPLLMQIRGHWLKQLVRVGYWRIRGMHSGARMLLSFQKLDIVLHSRLLRPARIKERPHTDCTQTVQKRIAIRLEYGDKYR